MVDEEFTDDIEKCMKLLDENEDILCDIECALDDQKEDELESNMQLHNLYDMADDVAESAKIRRAESNFMKRQTE